METLEKKLGQNVPTLVAFMKVGHQDVVDLKYEADDLKKEFKDKMNIMLIDGSFNTPLLKKYKIEHFPSWVLYSGKKEVWRAEGMQPLSKLTAAVKGFI